MCNIHPETAAVGKSLEELRVRESYGVIVAVIERGKRVLTAPSRDEIPFPGDRVHVFGTDEQADAFRQFLLVGQESAHAGGNEREEVRLQRRLVSSESPLLHKTMRQAGIREKAKGLGVGVEKNGERILNPDSDLIFEEGEMVWVVGSSSRLKKLEADG